MKAGFKTKADCTKGICVPRKSASEIGSYTNSCVKFCGQASCDGLAKIC